MSRTSAVSLFSFAVCAALGASLSGCYVTAHPVAADDEVVYESPPPQPAPEVEVVPVSPGPEYVWVGGYHQWEGRRYVWVRGHYERPRHHAHWVAPHWTARGHGHVWIGGRWE
jgi:hypothetical protein